MTKLQGRVLFGGFGQSIGKRCRLALGHPLGEVHDRHAALQEGEVVVLDVRQPPLRAEVRLQPEPGGSGEWGVGSRGGLGAVEATPT